MTTTTMMMMMMMMCQNCCVDEAGCYTDGAHESLIGKNVLSEGNKLGKYASDAVWM